MQNLKSNEKSFTIRLEPVWLVLEILKLQDKINMSWGTLILLIAVPWAMGLVLKMYLTKKINQIRKKQGK